jgi:DNA primase
LQIFLHFPAYRRQIYDILLREDIGFSLSHHRQLWQIITQLIEEGQIDFQAEEASPGQLVQLVQAQCAEQPALLEQLAPLLWLNENAKVALLRPALVIQAAVTRILLIMAEKTYRHWRDLWEKTDVNLHPALGLYYQTKLQEQRSKIEDLKRQLSSSTQILLQVSG